jgi:hypothetical protein
MSATRLLDSIREHLATYDLPEPWSVSVHRVPVYGRAQVSVQLTSTAFPALASVLLAWADTLADVRAEAWRVPDGSSVHLSMRGRLEDGTTVHVFDGVPYDARFQLDADQQQPISLAFLREWAAFDEGVAA